MLKKSIDFLMTNAIGNLKSSLKKLKNWEKKNDCRNILSNTKIRLKSGKILKKTVNWVKIDFLIIDFFKPILKFWKNRHHYERFSTFTATTWHSGIFEKLSDDKMLKLPCQNIYFVDHDSLDICVIFSGDPIRAVISLQLYQSCLQNKCDEKTKENKNAKI